MATYGNSSTRIARDSLRVAAARHPGWDPASQRMPAPGDQVQCAEGIARLVKILGKTGDGSRLLELALPDRPRHPYFAAASNVLVPPADWNGMLPDPEPTDRPEPEPADDPAS